MVSTVGTRPNYYEMLGLTPAATGDEIAKAFAREMGMLRVRPIGAAAVISIAFETLRNPAKRRAYDESIGLVRKSEPAAPPMPALKFAGSARWEPMVRPAIDPSLPPPPPPAPPPTRPDDRFEQRLASIAASVRELAKPGPSEAPPAPRAQPEAPSPQAASAPRPEPCAPDFLAVRDVETEALPDAEARPFAWKRPLLATGGLVLGVALLGAWAGLEAGSEAEAQEPEEAVTLALPPARPGPAAGLSALEPATVMAKPRPERRLRAADVARERRAAAPQSQRALSDQELEQLLPVDVSHKVNEVAAGAVAQTVAEAPSVVPTPAKLPLSNATIARTIGRIGYACGEVSSVVEAEGPGVFTVTCTSGNSYRAAPVRGRYHFRRLGGR